MNNFSDALQEALNKVIGSGFEIRIIKNEET